MRIGQAHILVYEKLRKKLFLEPKFKKKQKIVLESNLEISIYGLPESKNEKGPCMAPVPYIAPLPDTV